jgi:hypothetical protein
VFELVRIKLGESPPADVMQALRPLDAGDADILGAAMEALWSDQMHKKSVTSKTLHLTEVKSNLKKVSFLIEHAIFVKKELISSQFNTPGNSPGFYWLYLKRWYLLVKTKLPQLVKIARGERFIHAEMRRSKKIAQWLNQ